jgi:ketosteroid isomerase-like protein
MQSNSRNDVAAAGVAGVEDDVAATAAVLSAYNEALNASSVERSLALYADDGVFMPPYSQSAVGRAAVRKAYQKVFDTITLHVKFTIEEIVHLDVRADELGGNERGQCNQHGERRG